MKSKVEFNVHDWINEAFRAGIFVRVNSNGDLALDVADASPQDTQELLDRLSGHSEDVILHMPKPDSDTKYMN